MCFLSSESGYLLQWNDLRCRSGWSCRPFRERRSFLQRSYDLVQQSAFQVSQHGIQCLNTTGGSIPDVCVFDEVNDLTVFVTSSSLISSFSITSRAPITPLSDAPVAVLRSRINIYSGFSVMMVSQDASSPCVAFWVSPTDSLRLLAPSSLALYISSRTFLP